MIRYTQGNIFDAPVDAVVNTVNTEGVMGKGLALQFKRKYPENFKAYSAACKRGEVATGKMFVFPLNTLHGVKYVVNFPTKTTWRTKSKMEYVTQGLEALRAEILRLGIMSIAIPPLGCGLGGLLWPSVAKAIESSLGDLPGVNVLVYEPSDGAHPAPNASKTATQLTPARALLLRCFDKYMRLVPSVDISFVEAHKLAYMLQEVCGIGLRLDFRAWKYGPYAHNLTHVLSAMEGVWTVGWGDGNRNAFDTLRLLPAAQSTWEHPLPPEYLAALDKVDDFYCGFESPVGLELLATVHWLVNHDHVTAEIHAVQKAIASWGAEQEHPEWGKRKLKYFGPDTVRLALGRVAGVQ